MHSKSLVLRRLMNPATHLANLLSDIKVDNKSHTLKVYQMVAQDNFLGLRTMPVNPLKTLRNQIASKKVTVVTTTNGLSLYHVMV